MNTGAFGENFPYSNFHDLNMDWIIKIAKDFLDQYTHIQEIIEQGQTDITNLTNTGLQQIQDKADEINSLLDKWYATHSQDIANQLASAINEMNGYLDSLLVSFESRAEGIAEQTIASIPADYTALGNEVTLLKTIVQKITSSTKNFFIPPMEQGDLGTNGVPSDSDYFIRTREYIPIEPSSGEASGTYWMSFSFNSPMNNMVFYFFDANKGYISYVNKSYGTEGGNSLRTGTLEIPSNARYVKFKTSGSSGSNKYTPANISNIQTEYGINLTPYEYPLTANDQLARSEIDYLYSHLNNPKFNMIPFDELEHGCYYTDTRNTKEGFSATPLIEIEPTTTYVCRYLGNATMQPFNPILAYYDSNKNFIEWISSNTNTFTAPATAYYCRISSNTSTIAPAKAILMKQADYDDAMLAMPNKLNGTRLVDYTNIPYMAFACCRILCVGDSLTAGYHANRPSGRTIMNENYPYYLGRMLNCQVTNEGGSGGAPIEWLENHPNYNFTPFDTVIIELGTNGGLDSADINISGTETYAYCTLIDTIRNSNPNCRIMMMTVFNTGRLHDDVPAKSVETTNEAIRAIGTEKNVPYIIDISDLSYKNVPYLHGSNDETHFTKCGQIIMAKRVIEYCLTHFSPTDLDFGVTYLR